MFASRIQLPKNENPKEQELSDEDKNILAAFRMVFDGFRRAQARTRAVLKAYDKLESIALTLVKERDENGEESRKQNKDKSSSSNVDFDDELADVLLVDLTSDFDFEREELAANSLRSPSPIFGARENPSKNKRSFEEINSSKVGETSISTKLEVTKSHHGIKMKNKTTEGNEENIPLLGNTSFKIAAGSSEVESRLNANEPRPNAKIILAKTAYKIEKHKAPNGKPSKQSTLVFQPLAAKMDISCSEKMKPKAKVSEHWPNLFDEDYRVKKSTNKNESTAAEEKKDQPKVDKEKLYQPVESVSKLLGDKTAFQKEQKSERIIDNRIIMETPSQIDESARSLFEDEDLEDFQITPDLLNTCMDAPELSVDPIQPESPKNYGKKRKINDPIASTSKASELVSGQETIDETFFAPAHANVNFVKKAIEKMSPLAGCSKILTPKNIRDTARVSKRKSDVEPAEKDELEDLDINWDSDISNDDWSSPKRLLDNSFDIVPEKKNRSPEYAYKGKAERNKDKKKKLPGWDCWECEKYYKMMNLPAAELKKRMDACSRHKAKFNPRYYTPKDFWNPDFPDTLDSSDYSDNDRPVKKG